MKGTRALLGLLIAAGGACTASPRSHLPDAELRANFTRHTAAFERLAAMAASDRRFGRVALQWVDIDGLPTEVAARAIPPARWDEYRRLFREADVPEGMLRLGGLDGPVFFISSTEGMLGGSLKGYAYSKGPLSPLVPSLDDPASLGFTPERTTDRRFVRIGQDWYLVYQVS